MKDNDHLTLDELITSIKWCHGILGGDTCDGCPNLKPGTFRDFDGFGSCRCDVSLEALRFLEAMRGGDGDGKGK